MLVFILALRVVNHFLTGYSIVTVFSSFRTYSAAHSKGQKDQEISAADIRSKAGCVGKISSTGGRTNEGAAEGVFEREKKGSKEG
jgi:hypothetical protein